MLNHVVQSVSVAGRGNPLRRSGGRSRTVRSAARSAQRVTAFWHGSTPPVPNAATKPQTMAQRFQKARRSPSGETSISRVYADANTKEPSDYWEYESLAISWGCAAAVYIRQVRLGEICATLVTLDDKSCTQCLLVRQSNI